MENYEVMVQGHIGKRRFRGIGEIEIELLPSGESKIICHQFDSAVLHALITKIRDLGLQLIEVRLIKENSKI